MEEEAEFLRRPLTPLIPTFGLSRKNFLNNRTLDIFHQKVEIIILN